MNTKRCKTITNGPEKRQNKHRESCGQTDHKELQTDHKETKYNYKETKNGYKELQNSFTGMQNGPDKMQNEHRYSKWREGDKNNNYTFYTFSIT